MLKRTGCYNSTFRSVCSDRPQEKGILQANPLSDMLRWLRALDAIISNQEDMGIESCLSYFIFSADTGKQSCNKVIFIQVKSPVTLISQVKSQVIFIQVKSLVTILQHPIFGMVYHMSFAMLYRLNNASHCLKPTYFNHHTLFCFVVFCLL